MKSIRNSKGLYWSLIITFFVLYFCVGFVSTLHSITFFELANVTWMAVLLGITYEVGQASVLFSILMSDNNKKMLPWLLMILLTALQVTANVYASFKFMDSSGSNDWTYWQRSILFWLEADGPEMFKVVISWITGALLPVIALGMTALVAENLKLKDEQDKENNEKDPEPDKDLPDKDIEDGFSLEKENTTRADINEIKNIISEDDIKEDKNKKNLKTSYDDLMNEMGGYLDLQDELEVKEERIPEDEKITFKDREEQKKKFAEELLENQENWSKKNNPLKTEIKEEAMHIPHIESVDKIDKGIPPEEIDPEKLPNNPKGKKIIKKPKYSPRGWHLKGLHVDTNGDVYNYGKFNPEEKAEIPPEEQNNPPKKA